VVGVGAGWGVGLSSRLMVENFASSAGPFLLHSFHCCIFNLVMVAYPAFSLMRATV